MKLSDEYLQGWVDGKKEERERILRIFEDYVIKLEKRKDFKSLKPFAITTLMFIKIDELKKSSLFIVKEKSK